jgi:hypothetical protein
MADHMIPNTGTRIETIEVFTDPIFPINRINKVNPSAVQTAPIKIILTNNKLLKSTGW